MAIGSSLWVGALITIDAQPWKYFLLLPLVFLAATDLKIARMFVIVLLLGAALILLRTFSLHHNIVHELVGRHGSVKIIGNVQSDVVTSPARVLGSRTLPPRFTFQLRSELIAAGTQRYRTRVPLTISSSTAIAFVSGDQIECSGKLLRSRNPKVVALVTVRGRCTLLHSATGIWRVTQRIRAAFRREAGDISGDAGALIPGMILGDTSGQSAEFGSAMRRVGLTHLTAVSGENFAIVSAFVLWLLQWVFKSLSARIIVTAGLLLSFLFLVRPSPSVLRAAVMTAILLFARMKGRKSSALSALGLAVSTLILIDPFQAQDPGFALSVSATAGIILLSPKLATSWQRFFGGAAESISIPVSATLACTPIILAISGQFSLVSIPANLIVAPVVAPITVLGLIAALLAPVLPFLAHFLLLLISPCSHWITWVATNFAKFPVLSVTANLFTISFLTVIVVAAATKRWLPFGLLVTTLGILLWSPWAIWPMADWSFVNCNVGQGDASVINLGDHRAIVIDVGPDPALIDSCLNKLGVRSITLLVLTHFHADHVAGLQGALHERDVGSVWLSNLNKPLSESTMVKRALGEIPQHVVHAGQEIDLHQLSNGRHRGKVSVLWPGTEIKTFASMPGDGSAINNSSIALSIKIDGLRILEGADIEPPVQEAVLASGKIEQVQILKVSHHGSAYQYWPLVQRLHPQIAVISVGAGNSYGHPATRTLAALSHEHARILRTDLDGAIAIDNSLKIRVLKRDWWRFSWG